MKRKLILLLIVLIQSVILLGGRQSEELQPEEKVTDIIEKFNIDYEGIIKQNIVESLPVDEEFPTADNEEYQKEIVPEIIKEEIPIVAPVLLPITQRQANDAYPDSGEAIATINIPSLNLYQTVTYGDSQTNIDAYEICLRTYSRFDQSGAIILAGHNFKSFSQLKYLSIGSEIFIHSYYGDFTFTVDNISTGTTDGENIHSAEGNVLIDYYDYTKMLYLYTCDDTDPQKRLVVRAHEGGV